MPGLENGSSIANAFTWDHTQYPGGTRVFGALAPYSGGNYQDYWALYLLAGKTYVFQTRLPTVFDPYIYLYDSNGNYLLYDNNSGDDGSGMALIDPEGAEILTPRKQVIVRGQYRHIEWNLIEGETLYVLGEHAMLGGAHAMLDFRRDVSDLLSDWKRDRKSLLERFDANFKALDKSSDIAAGLDKFHQQALDILRSDRTKKAFDLSKEPDWVHKLYGTKPGKEAFSNNCLLARRLAERGVRFIQLFDWGWDTHGDSKANAINSGFIERCKGVDQAMSALLIDLKQRGLLEDTLVVWGGEFGRTPMLENRGGNDNPFVGRDHNPGGFTMWLAGGGIKPGMTYGETDPIGYAAVKDEVSVHDLHATMLALMGFDHDALVHPSQGANQRLTNITKTGTRVVREIIA